MAITTAIKPEKLSNPGTTAKMPNPAPQSILHVRYYGEKGVEKHQILEIKQTDTFTTSCQPFVFFSCFRWFVIKVTQIPLFCYFPYGMANNGMITRASHSRSLPYHRFSHPYAFFSNHVCFSSIHLIMNYIMVKPLRDQYISYVILNMSVTVPASVHLLFWVNDPFHGQIQRFDLFAPDLPRSFSFIESIGLYNTIRSMQKPRGVFKDLPVPEKASPLFPTPASPYKLPPCKWRAYEPAN